MAVPFNGQLLIQPQVATAFNLSGLAAQNPQQPYALALVGPANQGPNAWVTVQTPQDVINILGKDSDLANAAYLATHPSPVTNGANPILVYNVNPTTQGTITLESSSSAASVVLTTTRWGQAANLIKASVVAGSQGGYTVTIGDDYSGQSITLQNLKLPVFSLAYTGTAYTGVEASVTDTTLTVSGTASGATSPTTIFSISFANTPTVQALVNAINQQSGFSAVLLDPNPNDTPQALLDNVSNVAISSTATTFTANVTAVVRALNASTQPWVTAARQANATNLATTGSWSYATGGSTGAATTTTWQNAYTAAQQQYNILVIVAVNPLSTYWTMNDAHCAYMWSKGYGCVGIVGGSAGTTEQEALQNAASLTSPYTAYLVNGLQNVNLDGQPETFAPYIVAAQLGAMILGQPFNQALTAKPVSATGLEESFADSIIDQLVQGGCVVLKQVPWAAQPIVVKGQTTAAAAPSATVYQTELSAMVEQAILIRAMNAAMQPFVGQPITSTTPGKVASAIQSVLYQAYTSGWIVQVPDLSQIQVTVSGTDISATVQDVAITLPGDYVLVTLNATVYTAQAA